MILPNQMCLLLEILYYTPFPYTRCKSLKPLRKYFESLKVDDILFLRFIRFNIFL